MARLGCFYVRYMDDWVVLAPTRHKLRAAIRTVNQVMAELKVEKHPDKTSIGPVARGFDFFGYRFTAQGLAVARQTVQRCREKASRLYEQGAALGRIGEYGGGGWRWVQAGLAGRSVVFDGGCGGVGDDGSGDGPCDWLGCGGIPLAAGARAAGAAHI